MQKEIEIYQISWRLEAGSWKKGTAIWKIESGDWKLEPGIRQPEPEIRQPGNGGASCSSLLSTCPGSPVGPRAKYIRSGPEGARGVLNRRGWSFCIFLSELSSLKSSERHL